MLHVALFLINIICRLARSELHSQQTRTCLHICAGMYIQILKLSVKNLIALSHPVCTCVQKGQQLADSVAMSPADYEASEGRGLANGLPFARAIAA